MATNKFPGFCATCNKAVGAGHGDLSRAPSGAWVVTHAAPKAPTKPEATVAYASRRRRTYDSPGGIDGRGCGYPGCDGVRFCDDCSE